MKYAAAILGLLSAGVSLHASAQGTYNKRFDLFNEGNGQLAWGIEFDSGGNGVIFFGTSYFQDSIQYGSALSTVTISSNGDFGEGYRLHIPNHNSYLGWSNCSSVLTGGGYLVGGSTSSNNDSSKTTLFWVNEQGIVTNLIDLDLPGQIWVARQAKQAGNGDIYVCGETSQLNSLDGFFARTDESGNVQNHFVYGGEYGDRFTSIAIDNDSESLILGGQFRNLNTNTNLWVQKVDSNGSVLWNRAWGSEHNEVQAHVIQTEDDHIVAAANWGTGLNSSAKYLAKLDGNDGSILWERTYGESCSGCVLLVAQEVFPGGDLIAVGHTSLGGGGYYGSLLRTTMNGDSLWMRDYQYWDTLVGSRQSLLYDVQPVPNGGFVAVGVTLAVPGIYSQDVWVIKVDSMGCLEPGCHLITGIESQVTNLQGALTVAPNPVRSGEAVQVSISLPPSITPQGPLRLTVVSSEGRVVNEQNISPTHVYHHLPSTSLREGISSFSFDLSNLSSGLYHLHLSDGTRWLAGAKVVVE